MPNYFYVYNVSALHKVGRIWAIKSYGNSNVGCTFSAYCDMEIFLT